jgi:hypothetical protein
MLSSDLKTKTLSIASEMPAAGHCRFPLFKDLRLEEPLWCHKPTDLGMVYCHEHHKLTHTRRVKLV